MEQEPDVPYEVEVQGFPGINFFSISLKGLVTSDACHELIQKLRRELTRMSPGFVLLNDLTLVTGMPDDTYQLHIEAMETVSDHGVARVARVFGDEKKDVGLKLASNFHYEEIPVNHFPTITKALDWLLG